MKNILTQLGRTLMIIIGSIVQFISLIFVGIAWVFNKLGDLLNNLSLVIVRKAKYSKEVDSEEVIA